MFVSRTRAEREGGSDGTADRHGKDGSDGKGWSGAVFQAPLPRGFEAMCLVCAVGRGGGGGIWDWASSVFLFGAAVKNVFK